MTPQSRGLAGILLIVLPTVMYGGATLLGFLVNHDHYAANPLRQDLWRAGHAHAGVVLILALVALKYVDEAALSPVLKHRVRSAIRGAASLIPPGFFLPRLSPAATEPNALIYRVYTGAAFLASGVEMPGAGLLRKPST